MVRMLVDDWNDGLLFTWAQSAFKECAEQGESVLNSAMSAWVLDEYARMLRYSGDDSGLHLQVKRARRTRSRGHARAMERKMVQARLART